MKLGTTIVFSLAVGAYAATCDPKNAEDLVPVIEDLNQQSGGLFDPDRISQILDVDSSKKLMLAKRAELDCADNEICFEYRAKPLCLYPDQMNPTWRDSNGASGELVTGDYKLGDGRRGNLIEGPWPYPGDEEGGSTTSTYNIPTGTQSTRATVTNTADPNGGIFLTFNPLLAFGAFCAALVL